MLASGHLISVDLFAVPSSVAGGKCNLYNIQNSCMTFSALTSSIIKTCWNFSIKATNLQCESQACSAEAVSVGFWGFLRIRGPFLGSPEKGCVRRMGVFCGAPFCIITHMHV